MRENDCERKQQKGGREAQVIGLYALYDTLLCGESECVRCEVPRRARKQGYIASEERKRAANVKYEGNRKADFGS